MPKDSSARLRTRARALAARDDISHVAAHAMLTATSANTSVNADNAGTPMQWPDQIVDRDNRGWLHTDRGMYRGYDPSMTMPRPLTDDQLGELAVQPGLQTLTIEETAAVVEHLTLARIRAFSPENLAQQIDIEGITADRIAVIIERIIAEKTELGGRARFHVDRLGLDARPLAEIERHFGPWRPVLPMTDADQNRLRTAFEVAGCMLIGSTASALALVHSEACTRIGAADLDRERLQSYAHRTLTAGRPGSQHSEEVLDMVRFGSGLVAKLTGKGRDVQDSGQLGPNLKRVNLAARDEIAAVIRDWTNSPNRYTEVPANLAETIVDFADATYGAAGWKNIADQWLQPGSRDRTTFARCYFLFYTFSAHFNADLLL